MAFADRLGGEEEVTWSKGRVDNTVGGHCYDASKTEEMEQSVWEEWKEGKEGKEKNGELRELVRLFRRTRQQNKIT